MQKRIKALFSIIALVVLTVNLAPGSNASALDPVQIRWFVGLGAGSDATAIPIEQEVVNDFNATHPDIELILEVVPNGPAVAVLASQIANNNSPDIVGPVGWVGANLFHDQWEDLDPLIAAASYDTGQFPQELVDQLRTDIGQEALPFALYPSAIYFNAPMFIAAGLYYPPSRYGEQYEMPDGTMVDWDWDTVATVGKLLTLDVNGKNALDPEFDKNNIVQYGWTWQWENKPSYTGTYWKSGTNETFLVPGGTPGNYQARIPDAWKASWQWKYEGIWGSQPFIPSVDVENSESFGSGNPFDSGKIAMLESPLWYTCCLGDVSNWEVAIMPSYNGQVAGRIDTDAFRISKDSLHKTEAFTVMSYLIGEGVQKLLIGANGNPPAIGGLPARTADQLPWRVARHQQFPWVQNWKTFVAGLAYSDTPSAEAWMPNMNSSWNHSEGFMYYISSTPGLDVNTVSENFRAEMEVIFNAAPPTDIALSNDDMDENQPVGALVGTLSTTAVNPGFSYSLCGLADDASFQINGDSLESASRFDFEAKASYNICIRSTDNLGLDTTKLFTININDLNDAAPIFRSTGTQDGWVLESTEASNQGGTMDSAGTLLFVGDDAQDKQYKSVLSFNTANLPENAIITYVQLKFRYVGVVGTDMFSPTKTHSNLLVDIVKPHFGTTATLAVADFQAAANLNSAGVLTNISAPDWYTIPLKGTAFQHVNLGGTTQIRLRFTKDDNDDLSADYLKIYSGGAPAANRPQLIVEYYIPGP